MLLHLHCHGTMYRNAQGTARQQLCLHSVTGDFAACSAEFVRCVMEMLALSTHAEQTLYESVMMCTLGCPYLQTSTNIKHCSTYRGRSSLHHGSCVFLL